MKLLLWPSLALLMLTSASAQLQVQVPPPLPACALTETITPVVGISLQTYLDNNSVYAVQYTNDIQAALEDAGFRVYPDYTYQLLDLASISLEGRIDSWTNRSRDSSQRIGEVNLQVRNLGNDATLLTLKQPSPVLVFQAPYPEDFAKQVAQVMLKHFCQLPQGK
jgi:hypothetical protein